MTSHTLKVDNWSHCTTPSERNGPPLVAVKVGCFHINPASTRGRRIFLLQMVVLCFVPHAALLIQNCSIMAQLSQTFDSSIFLDAEVNTTLSLGEMILAIQEERVLVTKFLFSSSSASDLPNRFTLFYCAMIALILVIIKMLSKNETDFRTTLQDVFLISDNWLDSAPQSLVPETMKLNLSFNYMQPFTRDVINIMNLKAKESMKRISIYKQINAILLVYMMKNVKSTKSPLWRQLSACYELVHAIDELSIFLTLATYSLISDDGEMMVDVKHYLLSVLEHLQSVIQYLEVERIDASSLQDVYTFYTTSSFLSLNSTSKKNVWRETSSKYIESTYSLLEQLKQSQTALWITVRQSATVEIWTARRTLVVGISVLGVVICAAPVLVLLLRHTFYTIQTFTESIERSTQQLVAEKQKSDLLLSRMLPMPVLRRLRAQRTVPAEAFDAVTIYFSDIVGFTNIAATSTPMEIINMLNMLYRMFDDKIMQYNVYKVETIGDAYMVVSGLPQRNGNRHASEIADMSLALMRSLEGARVPHRTCDPLRIRAGVNTGPCVAGVVGTTMPRYCLFGDTINTASRMESTGEPMKIHISQTTKAALDEIGNYIMESRGVVDVQGKGPMETFWLVGKVGEMVIESPRCLRLEDYDQNVLELLIK